MCTRPSARLGFLALLLAVPLHAQHRRGIDIRSYDFRLTLSAADDTIRARAEVVLRRAAGAADTLELDLVGLTVDSVWVMEPPRYPTEAEVASRARFAYDGRVLRVPLALRRVRDDRVVVFYRGVPQDGLITRATARGRRSFFGDNWPERARFWLPTVDHPSDKAEVRWAIEAPRGWQVIANGWCSHPVVGRVRAYCTETRPIPVYTMVLGATEMSVSHHRPVVHGADTIPIEVWTYPEDSAFADSVPFRRASEIVETMERLVGPYPYRSLAHVQSSTRYGAMENSTAIFYGESSLVRRTLREGTVRHETSHQWFGDAVTPREWAHLWLSEGFADYLDAVIGAALDGDSVLGRIMRTAADTVFRSDVTGRRPVIDSTVSDPSQLLNPNSYQKGAWVLHMLRREVGDSAFFRGLREYYRRYRDSTALTEDFQRAMESAAGCPLAWFFDQWLRRPGFPQLDVRWVTRGDSVVLHVRQVQPAPWGRFRVPRVPVRLVLAGRRAEDRWFDLRATDEEQTVGFALAGGPPEALRVDPDGTVLLTAVVRVGADGR